jgi:hypothetical protein
MTFFLIIFICNVSLYKQTQNPQKHMFVISVTKVFLLFLWFSCDKFIWTNSHSITWTINGIAINLIIVYGELLFHIHHLHSTRIQTVGNNLANHISINIIFQDMILLGYSSGSVVYSADSKGYAKIPRGFVDIFL